MNDVVIRLTWSETGEFFDIRAVDPLFATWFVQLCKNNGNSYSEISNGAGSKIDLSETVSELKNNLLCVNEFLKKIKFPQLPIYDDLYDQPNLNATHKAWISLVRKEPRLDTLIYNVSPALFNQFHNINQLVHRVELHPGYQLVGAPFWKIENKFKNSNPPWGLSNVSLAYSDWGKSSFHKFVDGVTEPDDFELSNWNNISSDVKLHLTKPYNSEPPAEYINYCNKHKIKPAVKNWPLGDLLNYDKDVGHAREIMDHNIRIPNNYLSFSIV